MTQESQKPVEQQAGQPPDILPNPQTEQSPVDDPYQRIARLEQELSTLKQQISVSPDSPPAPDRQQAPQRGTPEWEAEVQKRLNKMQQGPIDALKTYQSAHAAQTGTTQQEQKHFRPEQPSQTQEGQQRRQAQAAPTPESAQQHTQSRLDEPVEGNWRYMDDEPNIPHQQEQKPAQAQSKTPEQAQPESPDQTKPDLRHQQTLTTPEQISQLAQGMAGHMFATNEGKSTLTFLYHDGTNSVHDVTGIDDKLVQQALSPRQQAQPPSPVTPSPASQAETTTQQPPQREVPRILPQFALTG